MQFKKSGGKNIIEIKGKLSNPYSIFSLIIFILLALLCFIIIVKWHQSPVIVLSALFIPLVLLVFLFKIVLWNVLGTETMVFGKNDLRVFYDYKVIYNKTIKNYNFDQFQLKLRSNTSTEQILLSDNTANITPKALYKLVFDMDKNKEMYQSSFSLKGSEVLQLQTLIGTQKSSDKPLQK